MDAPYMLEEGWHVKFDQLCYLEVLQMDLRYALNKCDVMLVNNLTAGKESNDLYLQE